MKVYKNSKSPVYDKILKIQSLQYNTNIFGVFSEWRLLHLQTIFKNFSQAALLLHIFFLASSRSGDYTFSQYCAPLNPFEAFILDTFDRLSTYPKFSKSFSQKIFWQQSDPCYCWEGSSLTLTVTVIVSILIGRKFTVRNLHVFIFRATLDRISSKMNFLEKLKNLLTIL